MKIYRSRADVESAIDQEVDIRLDIANKEHKSNYSKQDLLGDCWYTEEKTKFQFLNDKQFESEMAELIIRIRNDIENAIIFAKESEED